MGAAREPAPYALSRDAGLWVLFGFTALSLVGFSTFGLHPELLPRVPQVAGFYGPAFRFFAVGQIWVAGAVLALFLLRRAGLRWLPAFAVLYGISLGSELLGTGYGIPFGDYRYSALLEPMWLGRVPVVIPLSWFFMAVPSYALARLALPGRERLARRVLLASAVLLAWDLSLDPAMSHATSYWVWGAPGAYYGMPWLNLFGWYVTGLALMGALALLRSDGWIAALPFPWLAAFYGANLLLPLGMSAAAGLWGAVLATLAVLGATVGIAWRLARHRRPSPALRPSPAGAAGAAGPNPVRGA